VIVLNAGPPHPLEVIYWILGGAGLFVIGAATLVFAAGARGLPLLRSNTLHRHTIAAPSEPCEAKITESVPGVTWQVWIEVANVGRGFLIVDGAGLVTPSGETMTVGAPSWTVNGIARTEPFSLSPGEIARVDQELPTDRSKWTGEVAVFVTVRRLFGWSLRRAVMKVRPGPGGVRSFTFVKEPQNLVARV